MKYFLFFLLIGYNIHKSAAQTFTTQIDSLISLNFKDANGPGGVFMVAKKGIPVYQKAVGKANLELDVNMTTDQVFQLGSVTKQFTAMAILMLEEQGKLSVNDSISKFIPDYPGGHKISIHHLLTHTSGIKDFTRMKSLEDIAQKNMSPKMLVDYFKNEPVNSMPGEKFEYNNSGYVVLGYIIELVSNLTYEQFIKKNIFQPLGMKDSYYASDKQIILKRACGYHKNDSNYVNKNPINYSIPFSAGSLMSTAADMLKWQNALSNNVLLNEKNSKKAFIGYKLNNGETNSYGYGWHIKTLNGITSREHGGSIFGFKTMGVYIPSEDIYVVGLSNCDCNSPTQLTRDIAALMLKYTSGNTQKKKK